MGKTIQPEKLNFFVSFAIGYNISMMNWITIPIIHISFIISMNNELISTSSVFTATAPMKKHSSQNTTKQNR